MPIATEWITRPIKLYWVHYGLSAKDKQTQGIDEETNNQTCKWAEKL